MSEVSFYIHILKIKETDLAHVYFIWKKTPLWIDDYI